MRAKITENLSMRRRFVVTFICLILLPLLILNLILTVVQYQRSVSQYLTSNQYSFSNIPEELERDLDFAFNFSNVVYNDYDINMFLNTKFKNNEEFYEKYSQYSVKKLIDFYANQSKNISDPIIYTNNSTIQGETINIKKINSSVTSEKWYKKYLDTGKKSFIYFDTTKKYAYIIQKLDYIPTTRFDSFLKIEVDMDYVNNKINKLNIPCTAYFYGNNSLPAYEWDFGYSPKAGLEYYGLLTENDVADDVTLVFSNNIENYGTVRFMIILSSPPIVDKDILISAVITLFLTLAASLVFMRSMERNYIKRIENLVSSIDVNEFILQAQRNNFVDKQKSMHTQNNELAIIEETMSNMSTRIHDLIKEAYTLEMEKNQAEIRRKQSELNSLLSQINPHYLFNVLNAIRLKCILKGEKETAKIILYISKIFRQRITWDKDIISLNEEMTFIKEYLAVEKYRFEDKLTYITNIDETCLGTEIPKMSLQPFVENACVHGIQDTIGNGEIVIDVKDVDEEYFSFAITNPVAQFDEEKKQQIIGYSQGNFDVETKSVGLKNTFARLRYYYSDFDFDIIEEENYVTFKLILRKKITQNINSKEKNNNV